MYWFGHEILHRQEGLHGFVRLQIDQAGNVLALAGGAGVGNFVDLEPEDAALGGEDQQIGVRGGDHQMLDHVLGARAHADAALAAARLAAVGIDGGALQIAAARNGNGDVLHLDQIFELDLAGVLDDLRAALVAELLLDFLQFLHDDAAQLLVGCQDLQIFGDLLLNVGQFIQDLLLLHAGEALELQSR